MKTNIPMLSNNRMSSHDADGLANAKINTINAMPAQKILDSQVSNETHPVNSVERTAQHAYESHFQNGGPQILNGHLADEIQSLGANDAIKTHAVYDPLYSIIAALWRQRYAWVKSRTAMTLSGQSRCRAFANGDKAEAAKLWKAYLKGETIDAHLAVTLEPYAQAVAFFDEHIKPVEKQLGKLIKGLPCYEWMNAHKGIGAMYIAGIYGECNGPITKSHSVSALWKFFGLAVFEGKRQAFSTDAAINKAQSYSPRRRSLISQLESGLIMTRNEEWKAIYMARKEYELERGLAKGHAHNRAKRYMGKRFLRELYSHAKKVEVDHFDYGSQTENVTSTTNLNGQSSNKNHLVNAVQGEATQMKTGHENDASPTNLSSQNKYEIQTGDAAQGEATRKIKIQSTHASPLIAETVV